MNFFFYFFSFFILCLPFSLRSNNETVSEALLDSLLKDFYSNDPSLKTYLSRFNFSDYSIFRVKDRDLFYLDDSKELIKTLVIKQGLEWKKHLGELYKTLIKPGSKVLDIGGHIGTQTLSLSRIVGKEGTVYVFEPQTKLFCELAINMHLNNCHNVKMFHNALGAEKKEDEKTKTIRLDDLNIETVSFIKMSVEGHEMEVIKGAAETIKRSKPIMVIEILQNQQREGKINEIQNMGYLDFKIYDNDFLFLPKEIYGVNKNNDHVELPSSNSPKKIKVSWEGSFLDIGSLSNVNRYFVNAIEKNLDIQLSCINTTSNFSELLMPVELAEITKKLKKKSDNDTEVTIRHQWPPMWNKPKGKWVVIQPWEFGALPLEWVKKADKVDEFWVYTHFIKNIYVDSGIASNKVFVIPLGVDITKFNVGIEPLKLKTNKKFKFLFVGGTIHRKGPDILLESYMNTFFSDDDVCLVIKDFGSNGCYAGQTYKEIIEEYQKEDDAPEILYLDDKMTTDEIAQLYRACDCFVSSYRGEGFAMPVLEAMACGLPVVVTKGGATDDFVTNESGWFIPSKVEYFGKKLGEMELSKEGWLLEPDCEALSDMLYWIACHPSKVKKKGIAASEQAKKWTWDHAAKLVSERLYNLSGSDKQDKRDEGDERIVNERKIGNNNDRTIER